MDVLLAFVLESNEVFKQPGGPLVVSLTRALVLPLGNKSSTLIIK